MNLPSVRKPFPLTKQEAKKLRICWYCGESTQGRRRSAFFCDRKCKQGHYRLMCKARAELAELQSVEKSVTVSPAIGARSVTNFSVSRTSGKQTPSQGER